MGMLNIPHYAEAFAADGTNGGVILVLDSSKFWPGAKGSVAGDGLPGKDVQVLELMDATHIRVKEIYGPADNAHGVTYAGANLSAYTLVKNSTITIPDQAIFYQNQGGVRDRIPTVL